MNKQEIVKQLIRKYLNRETCSSVSAYDVAFKEGDRSISIRESIYDNPEEFNVQITIQSKTDYFFEKTAFDGLEALELKVKFRKMLEARQVSVLTELLEDPKETEEPDFDSAQNALINDTTEG